MELRAAWATQREVIVTLSRGPHTGHAVPDLRDAPADRGTLRGYVVRVAASGAYALLWDGRAEAHVPAVLVGNVRKPYRLNAEDGSPVEPPPPRQPIELEGQMSLF